MLELDDLHVHYGNIRALEGVSLRVAEGELVAIIGSNGAGKSTTLKTISGLLRPSRGTIRYQGVPIERAATDQIVRLGISHCPEGRRIFGRLTVRENLILGGIQRSPAEVRADLEMVGELFPRLRERMNQAGGTLSGGEQQMLAIGRALMARPKLMLLDEPSLGLSPLLVKEIFGIIKEINEKEKATILLVEQNAKAALRLARRAYVMESGRIVMQGKASDLANDPGIKKAYLGE